jgi:hypothetical protein
VKSGILTLPESLSGEELLFSSLLLLAFFKTGPVIFLDAAAED